MNLGLREPMRRREFIALLGSTAIARPLAARAQQPKVPTIGVLVHDAPGWQQFWQVFRETLRELGYIEGQSIRLEFRSDHGVGWDRGADRASHDADVSSIPPIIPYGGFSPVRLEGWPVRRDLPSSSFSLSLLPACAD
jgi:hypothetical protein